MVMTTIVERESIPVAVAVYCNNRPFFIKEKAHSPYKDKGLKTV